MRLIEPVRIFKPTVCQDSERELMLRPARLIVCLLACVAGLAGCSSGLGGKLTGRSEQWEPDVEETQPTDWRSGPSSLRSKGDRASSEDRLDKFIWSDTARDINRSLGGSL